MFESHNVLHRAVTCLPLVTQGDQTPDINNPYPPALVQHFLASSHATQVFVSKPFQATSPPLFSWPIHVPQLPSRKPLTSNRKDHTQLPDRPTPESYTHPVKPYILLSKSHRHSTEDTTPPSRGTSPSIHHTPAFSRGAWRPQGSAECVAPAAAPRPKRVLSAARVNGAPGLRRL